MHKLFFFSFFFYLWDFNFISIVILHSFLSEFIPISSGFHTKIICYHFVFINSDFFIITIPEIILLPVIASFSWFSIPLECFFFIFSCPNSFCPNDDLLRLILYINGMLFCHLCDSNSFLITCTKVILFPVITYFRWSRYYCFTSSSMVPIPFLQQ